MTSKLFVRALMLGAAAALIAAAGASAQPKPVKDYKAAPAGNYGLDNGHTSVSIRVPHMGFSYEVFRFREATGGLGWDPDHPATDTLSVSVDPASIMTADTGQVDFAKELTGDKFLNVAKFATATFVSKGFHPVDTTHGKVNGDLTIMGVTQPASFDVELVGAGPGFKGPVIGVTAKTMIDVKTLGLPPFITGPVELTIDTEFDKK